MAMSRKKITDNDARGRPAPSHQEHDHGHDHRHVHEVGEQNERRVLWALLLTGAYMVVEVAGGLIAGSLALLADAGHMLTDAAALGLAWTAFRVARRPHDVRRTYGYHRVQVLAAFVNGVTLVVIVVWIAIEAVRRFFEPVEILGEPMLAVATVGFVVNLVVFLVLHRGGPRRTSTFRLPLCMSSGTCWARWRPFLPR